MVRRRLLGSLVLVALGIALLANPLYVHSHSERGGHVAFEAQSVPLEEGLARTTGEVRAVERLPTVERVLAERVLDGERVAVERDDPPLWATLLDEEWTYVGSQAAAEFYEPTVVVENGTTTVGLDPVSDEEVLDRLAVTIPEDLRDSDHPRKVAVVGQESEQVVLVESFPAEARADLETAVEEGAVSVANRNDESAFGRLGDDWPFVLHDGAFYRVQAATSGGAVELTLDPVAAETVVEQVESTIVSVETLAPENQRAVSEAVAIDGTYVAHGDEVDGEGLVALDGQLVRVDGQYYEIWFHHDHGGWDLSGPKRTVFGTLGAVCLFAGIWSGRRAWAGSPES